MNKPKGKEKFNEGVAARLLRSMDFSPTEIAKILGKKSATDVSKYLYGKKAADETTDEEKADVIQNAEKPVAKKENNKSELQGGIAVNE
jgi:predicted transcriptional regulator